VNVLCDATNIENKTTSCPIPYSQVNTVLLQPEIQRQYWKHAADATALLFTNKCYGLKSTTARGILVECVQGPLYMISRTYYSQCTVAPWNTSMTFTSSNDIQYYKMQFGICW